MKKILIIGASILQLPAIKRAKEMGYYVGVVDQNPQAVGVLFADEYFCVSTVDCAGIVAVAERFAPDGVLTLATDMPVRSVALTCERLGLAGVSTDTAYKATDKGAMIRAFEEYGVPHPWYYLLDDPSQVSSVADKLSYPCISKPTDNSGSRGVMLIKNAKQLEQAVAYSSSMGRQGKVIIEEYLTGHEVSVEIMALRGAVHVLQVTDKLTTGAPHFVEMGHSQPSMLPEQTVQAICELAVNAVKAVGLTDGAAHVEIMVTPSGPKMIELGARMGGDCITTHLVPLSTGIDMIEASIRLACGEKPDLSATQEKGAAIRYFDVPSGKIHSIRGLDEARQIAGVQSIAFTKTVGDTVGEIGSSGDRVGFVIAQAATADEAIKVCEQVMDRLQIDVELER